MSQDNLSKAQEDAVLRSDIDRSLRHPVMFFFTSGAAWLAVAILLGLLATAKMVYPSILSHCEFLTTGRVFAAHISTLIYGWGFQAAFGVLIWLISRLTRQPSRAAGIILAAGHVWNLLVAVGVIFVLAGNGTGVFWLEFPKFIYPAFLFCYFLIAVWTMIQFRVKAADSIYVSQWFAVAALIWMPWILATAYLFVFVRQDNALMAAAVAAWYRSALTWLFFIPAAAAAAFYLSPKVTGRPVHSYQLSRIGFWTLAIVAPWAGLQKLAGVPIPYFLPYLGAAATVLLGAPCVAIAISNLRTIYAEKEKLSASPSLHFVAASMFCLILLGIFSLLTNFPGSTLPMSQFSLTVYGMDILALYGVFSFAMFGAVYFIVPRLTKREWLSSRFIKWHFIFSIYGVVAVSVISVLLGLMHGQAQENVGSVWHNAVLMSKACIVGAALCWLFVLFSNVFFFLHLLLMWMRLGRRSTHPTLLPHSHDSHGPHGQEGDIDNCGPGTVLPH